MMDRKYSVGIARAAQHV